MTPTLTTKMRAALHELRKQPARRIHNPALPGKPPWPHHPSTLAALVRHELVERDKTKNAKRLDVDIWTITNAGRAALEPPDIHKPDRARYLQRDIWRGGDYTTDPHRRIDDLEVAPDDLSAKWEHAATRRHAAAQDPRQRARRTRAA